MRRPSSDTRHGREPGGFRGREDERCDQVNLLLVERANEVMWWEEMRAEQMDVRPRWFKAFWTLIWARLNEWEICWWRFVLHVRGWIVRVFFRFYFLLLSIPLRTLEAVEREWYLVYVYHLLNFSCCITCESEKTDDTTRRVLGK